MGLDSTGSSPVFPNLIINPYNYFFNQLQITSAQRKLYFNVNLFQKSKQLAELLIHLNVIRRFYRIKGNLYRVFPTYSRFRKQARALKSYTRVRGRHNLRLKTIQTLNLNTPNTHYILETDKGLMTHKDALKHSIGGSLLAVVY